MPQDSHSNRRLLYEIADSQGGYFTAQQALQVGYAYSQQHFHRQSGAWEQVARANVAGYRPPHARAAL